jgi:hypothetical protein
LLSVVNCNNVVRCLKKGCKGICEFPCMNIFHNKILPKTPVTMVKIRENQLVRQWSKFV